MRINILSLYIIFLVSLLVSCSSKKVKNDLTNEHIKGNVKSISVQHHQAIEKFGIVQEGELTSAKISKYDIRGFIIEDDEIVRKSFYTYTFNKSKLPIEKNIYNSDSSLVSRLTYKYDEKGNRIEENSYNSEGELQMRSYYKHDKNGNVIEENNYDSAGALLSKFVNEYDENGNRSQYNGYRSDGRRINRFTYKYNNLGHLIQENQILLNTDDSSFSASTIHYTYPEFDKTGNWIKQTILNEQKTATIIRNRELKYFQED